MAAHDLVYQTIEKTDDEPSVLAGTLRETADGRRFLYVQAAEALAQGDVVKLMNGTGIVINADVDKAAAADTIRVTATGDFTTTALTGANYLIRNGHPHLLWIDAGAAQAQGGWILNRIDDNNVDVYWITSNDGKIATALTTSSDYVVAVFTRVERVAAGTDLAVGVAQTAVTTGHWFWMQVGGWGVARLDTDDAAVEAAHRILVPSATTSGCLMGITSAIVATSLASEVGRTIIDVTGSGLIFLHITTEQNLPFSHNGAFTPADTTLAFPRLS